MLPPQGSGGSGSGPFTRSGTTISPTTEGDTVSLTGPFRLYNVADGSAAQPALSWENDTNTGLYRSGPEKLSIATNGTQRAEFTTTGATVTGTLAVSNDIHGVAALGLISDNGSGAEIQLASGANANIRLSPLDAGQVTINEDVGLQRSAAGVLKVTNGGASNGTLEVNTVQCDNAQEMILSAPGGFRLEAGGGGAADVGLQRTAAGVLKVTDGGAGAGTLDAAALKLSGTVTLSPTFLSTQYSDANNTDAAETDLHSYTLPAGTLARDGDAIEIEAWATTAANGNAKTFQVYWNGVSVGGSSSSTASDNHYSRIVVVRTGATSQRIIATPARGATNGVAVTTVNVHTGSATLSGTVVIKTTGQGGASNDITGRVLTVKRIPAGV